MNEIHYILPLGGMYLLATNRAVFLMDYIFSRFRVKDHRAIYAGFSVMHGRQALFIVEKAREGN